MAKGGDWTFTLNGRFNTFFVGGTGDSYPAAVAADPGDPTAMPPTDPRAGSRIIDGGGLKDNFQAGSDGKFRSTRIRNGFVANVLGFGIKRNVTDTTTLRGYMAFWSDVETNMTRYLATTPDVRESYLRLDGPWGSFLAGRTLGLFSRGALEIDRSYGHGYGLGFPCNIDGIGAACGMSGFGLLFPYYAGGMTYTTPSLGGLKVAVGIYDPVRVGGFWDRATYPRAEFEAAYQLQFGESGLFKAFASGVFQNIGKASQLNDMSPVANKTVNVVGIAGGLRAEVGPVRIGLAGHQGQGLGFTFALENTPSAAYQQESTAAYDARTGNLRTYRGFYGQLGLALGKIDLAAGAGVSQLVAFSYDPIVTGDAPATTTAVLPKQQLGISGGLFYHVQEYLVLSVDVFKGQYLWYGTGLPKAPKQDVLFGSLGVTIAF